MKHGPNRIRWTMIRVGRGQGKPHLGVCYYFWCYVVPPRLTTFSNNRKMDPIMNADSVRYTRDDDDDGGGWLWAENEKFACIIMLMGRPIKF